MFSSHYIWGLNAYKNTIGSGFVDCRSSMNIKTVCRSYFAKYDQQVRIYLTSHWLRFCLKGIIAILAKSGYPLLCIRDNSDLTPRCSFGEAALGQFFGTGPCFSLPFDLAVDLSGSARYLQRIIRDG
jgi:hypothetical protein